ncbi:hypothetical protein BGZ63DRAFT_465447 [Mariannaea sp. PMI_226]|nr:hypothetical protein BGZ63DRAFT_465447 [Mariannaea sp. PMI_226]
MDRERNPLRRHNNTSRRPRQRAGIDPPPPGRDRDASQGGNETGGRSGGGSGGGGGGDDGRRGSSSGSRSRLDRRRLDHRRRRQSRERGSQSQAPSSSAADALRSTATALSSAADALRSVADAISDVVQTTGAPTGTDAIQEARHSSALTMSTAPMLSLGSRSSADRVVVPPGRVVEEQQQNINLRCCNCGSTTHKIQFCMLAPLGYVEGRCLCHDATHTLEDCRRFRAMPFREQVRLVVWDRRRMPPYETSNTWWDYLADWREETKERDEDGNVPLPPNFPWSQEFAKAQCENADAIQEAVDADNWADVPEDPATKDLAAVMAYF